MSYDCRPAKALRAGSPRPTLIPLCQYAQLVVARAIKTVPVPPGDLFRFMVSVDGYKIIDPDTKNHEEPPIERLPWRDRRVPCRNKKGKTNYQEASAGR